MKRALKEGQRKRRKQAEGDVHRRRGRCIVFDKAAVGRGGIKVRSGSIDGHHIIIIMIILSPTPPKCHYH